MTITIDIRPEVQAELARQAAANGRDLEAHAANLLEEAAHVTANKPDGRKSLREMFEDVRGLADDVKFSRNPSTGRPLDLP